MRTRLNVYPACALAVLLLGLVVACGASRRQMDARYGRGSASGGGVTLDTAEVLAKAALSRNLPVVTVTATRAERSAGGPHDYFSEGLYWWPDPANPDGPYLRRDGEPNPDNFNAHRDALRAMTDAVSDLTAAYLITDDASYARDARRHLRAWFVDTATRMNPNLRYGQAIWGRNGGRFIGIIDTRELIYAALAADRLAARGQLGGEELAGVRRWFEAYAEWLVFDEFGIDERYNGNNHSSWWGAQVAAFAKTAQRADLLDTARVQYREQLARQLRADGLFPEELARTKPGDYSRFNLDALCTLAAVASAPGHDLWRYRTPSGATLAAATAAHAGLYAAPETWTYGTDLEPALEPVAADWIYFAAQHYGDPVYARLWRTLGRDNYYGSLSKLLITTSAAQ